MDVIDGILRQRFLRVVQDPSRKLVVSPLRQFCTGPFLKLIPLSDLPPSMITPSMDTLVRQPASFRLSTRVYRVS